MGVWKSFAGIVRVELVSADIPAALAQINALGIQIFDVTTDRELTVLFQIYRQDFRQIKNLAVHRGERIRVINREGLFWKAKGFLHRPVLAFGLLLILFLVFFVPTRIYFIQVEGNTVVPTKRILAAAEECGIRFGASRRQVRSEKMKNTLLEMVPDLQWAGVNTYGCVAVISVRERPAQQSQDIFEGVSNIIAVRDGVVLSCTVTRGTGQCVPGQAVRAGELLISGYTDCGLAITAVRAEGEIMAQTKRELSVVTPAEYQIRGTEQSRDVKFSLLIGKKQINFYKDSGISPASCVKMYSEYYLTLPGGFRLPVTLLKEESIFFESEAAQKTEEFVESSLIAFASDYLQTQMVAGQIIGRDETTQLRSGVYCLTGEYACIEMIGRMQAERNGEYDGKTN